MNYGESNSYQGAPQVTYQRPDVNESARYAAQHGGGEEHGSMFSSILSSVLDRDDDKRPVEEDEVKQAANAHDRIYNQGGVAQASSKDMGLAAAFHAFKQFTSKWSSGGGGGGGQASGSSQLIGLAMAEAMSLMKGNANAGGTGGSSQSEMLKAAASLAVKLYASQSGNTGNSTGSSGGLSTLMGLLGKSSGGGSSSSSDGNSSGKSGVASLISKFL